MQSRLDRLGGGELCEVCGHGYGPPQLKVVFVGLPPKPGWDMETRDTPPEGPDECPRCGWQIRFSIRFAGLPTPEETPHLP